MKKILLKNNPHEILVSDKDYRRVIDAGPWYYAHHYAIRSIKKPDGKWTTERVHRFITGVQRSLEVDHRDGNGLNNQRRNLRVCTHKQNEGNRKLNKNNTSGYKGVSWNKSAGKWQVHIRKDSKSVNLGYFVDKEEAARAYDKASRMYHKTFSKANFKGGKLGIPEEAQG